MLMIGLRPSRAVAVPVAMLLVIGVTACRPGPGDPVESGVGDMVTVTFAIGSSRHEYVGFGTQSMTITPDDVQRIGTAVQADRSLFPDVSVYALSGVNPVDGIVLLDRSVDPNGEPVLFTRDGISPPSIPGICLYYNDPERIGCAAP